MKTFHREYLTGHIAVICRGNTCDDVRWCVMLLEAQNSRKMAHFSAACGRALKHIFHQKRVVKVDKHVEINMPNANVGQGDHIPPIVGHHNTLGSRCFGPPIQAFRIIETYSLVSKNLCIPNVNLTQHEPNADLTLTFKVCVTSSRWGATCAK